MKIAVCISGQARFINESYKYLFDALYPGNIDYFLHLWNDEQYQTKDILNIYNPVSYIICPSRIFTSNIDLESNHGKVKKTQMKPSDMISMLYSRYMVGKLLEDYNKLYNMYIWTRTDFCPIENILNQVNDLEYVYTAYVEGEEWNNTHLNTVFICSNLTNILHYMNLYSNYEKLFLSGIDYCEHRLAMHHMKEKTNQYKQILGCPCETGNTNCRKWGLMRSNGFSKL